MSGGVEVLTEPGAALEPHRHHRLRRRGAARRCGSCSTRTRLGLFVRGVTQNRAHGRRASACRTARVDTLRLRRSARASPASPAARCRRSATSVPTSARATSSTRSWSSCSAASASSPARCTRRWASASLNKLLEAVRRRGARQDRVLVFIIVFIQKRPQGLFALKGRAAEA